MSYLLQALRVLIALTVVVFCLSAVGALINPEINDPTAGTITRIRYSSLTTECFDVSWQIPAAEVKLGEEVVSGEGTGQLCAKDVSRLTVTQPDGTQRGYDRAVLWDQIMSHAAITLISLSAFILTFYVSIQASVSAIALTLCGIAVWILLGQPTLPFTTFRALPFAQVTPQGQALFLALIVPPLHWLAQPRFRLALLLGVSIVLLFVSAVSLEYIALLSLLIALTWAVMPRPVYTLKPLSRLMTGMIALLMTAFSLGLGVLSQVPRARPANDALFLISALCIAIGALLFLTEKTLRQSGWRHRHVLPAVLIAGGFLLLPLLDHFAIQAVENLAWWIFILGGTGLCVTLCGLLRYRASDAQQRFIGVLAIGLIIIVFIIFKWPPYTAYIRVFGFSYIAFRLLHVLLERRLGQPLAVGSLKTWSLYIIFFPSQAVGPIDRWPRFADDAQKQPAFSWPEIWAGWERILWGAVKKFVIADIVLGHVYPGQISVEYITPLYAWLQLYVFAFYLYYDFSGFVDIAIGTARLLGFHLPENFDRPYTRGSLAQFWQSWHMTLSGWLRSYVFLPLSRSLLRTRLKRSPLFIVLMANLVTMSLIGLWHGLTWNFLAWGLWHAVGLFLHKVFSDRTRRTQMSWRKTWRERAFHIFSVALTFHFVVLGWVFFAFPNFEDSLRYLAFLIGLRI